MPILVFYGLTYMLTMFRICFTLLIYGNHINEYLILNFGMPLSKINMGLNQCWVLIELALRVNLSLKLSKQDEIIEDETVR